MVIVTRGYVFEDFEGFGWDFVEGNLKMEVKMTRKIPSIRSWMFQQWNLVKIEGEFVRKDANFQALSSEKTSLDFFSSFFPFLTISSKV